MDWVQIFQSVGVPVGLLIFVTWSQRERDKQRDAEIRERESRMAGRIDDVENFNRDRLLSMNVEMTTAIKQSTAALELNTKVMEEFLRRHDV